MSYKIIKDIPVFVYYLIKTRKYILLLHFKLKCEQLFCSSKKIKTH